MKKRKVKTALNKKMLKDRLEALSRVAANMIPRPLANGEDFLSNLRSYVTKHDERVKCVRRIVELHRAVRGSKLKIRTDHGADDPRMPQWILTDENDSFLAVVYSRLYQDGTMHHYFKG
jgi:hypothetical protein